MQFQIEGELRTFIEVKSYRAMHDLPDTFGITLFEQKSYDGLGNIEHAGPALNTLRQTIIDMLPKLTTLPAWLAYSPYLTIGFRDALVAINGQIGLREPEIDFAAAGFGDVCSRWIYVLIEAQANRKPAPRFEVIYAAWLYDSVRISAALHKYPHQNDMWAIRVITHAYGRMGLQITRGENTEYVYDHYLACPAEGFMFSLLQTSAATIRDSVDANNLVR